MPSTSSLVARITVATALAAAIAGLVAALSASVVADRLVQSTEDRRLRDAATIVLSELTQKAADELLRQEIDEETAELEPAAIEVALHRDGRFVAGERRLPDVPAGECVSRELAGSVTRACAMRSGDLVVVAAGARIARGREAFLLGCLAATALAVIIAALAGRAVARWSLRPLTRLRESVDGIAAFDPRSAPLTGDDSCLEVAALRGALTALLARLGDALDASRRFSADAAHEIRTPLTAIGAELDLLAEEPLDEESSRAVARLRARVAALGRLVERLLALATTRGDSHLEMDAVALEDIARDAVARLPESARLRVQATFDAQGMVRGDEALLSALVENAVENALKFSGSEPIQLVIRETDDPKSAVVLDVIDRGPGLDQSQRLRVFEPFFRTPGVRGANTPGHGLGLALVAQIVAVHGGTAEFVDTPTRGAHLTVRLPAWEPAS